MLGKIKKRFGRNGNKKEIRKERRDTVGERVDRYAEAVAFAEAGLQDVAQDLVRSDLGERPKVLVVGKEDSFSKPLIEYAVGFAKRMSYDIVALNCVPIGHEAPKVLTPYQQELRKKFEDSARKGAEELMKRAEAEGVRCHHVVKFGVPDLCIRQLNEELRRVEFVLTEPETSIEEGKSPVIPVFCLVE